jgi:hypothetical protein
MENTKEIQAPAKKRNLTEQEQFSITRVRQRRIANKEPIFRVTEIAGKEALELGYDDNLEHNDALDLFEAHVLDVTGASNSTVGLQWLTSIGKAIVPAKADLKEFVRQMETVALTMRALTPQDEFEGQLIAQLVVLHEHAMEWLGKAMRTDRVDFSNVYINGASKLLTRHHETLETLLKYRRRGEQRVVVEHVNVHNVGQAIVGNVTTRVVG